MNDPARRDRPSRTVPIVLMLAAFAAIGHFNRVGMAVVGTNVLIRPEPTGNDRGQSASRPAVAHRDGAEQPFAASIAAPAMGWVYSMFLIVYTIAMLPGGWLIDRHGPVQALAWFGWTMGVFVALTGVLGWAADTPTTLWCGLLAIRGLAGLCSAPLHPGAARMVSDVVRPSGRAAANGSITAGALVGIALAYPVYGFAIERCGWPTTCVAFGLAMAAFATVWRVVADQEHAAHRAVALAGASESSAYDLRVAGDPALWILTLSYASYSYFLYLMFYWMGHYFKNVLSVDPTSTAWAMFWISLGQGAGMLAGGVLADALTRAFGMTVGRRLLVIGALTMCGILGAVAVTRSGWLQVAIWMGAAMALQGMCEGVYWTAATELGGRRAGFAGAFLNAGGNIGGFISPVVTPILATRLGWPGAITVACVVSFCGGLMWLGIRSPADER